MGDKKVEPSADEAVELLLAGILSLPGAVLAEPYGHSGIHDDTKQVYLVKRLLDKDRSDLFLAYNRRYEYLGTLSVKEFGFIHLKSDIKNYLPGYEGGTGTPEEYRGIPSDGIWFEVSVKTNES